MKRMLSILALLGAFLLMPFVAQAQQMCSITVEQPQGGTIKVYPGTKISGQTVAEVKAGSQVTMRLSPTKGYKIDYWLVNGNRVEIDPGTAFVNNKKTITISEPTTISAVLKESGYLVSYEQPEGGTLMVKTIYPETDVPSGTRVEEGKSLKITATVNEGNQFKHFLVNDEVKVPSNLTQPRIDVTANSDLTIAAVIETAQPCIVTIKPFDHGYLKVTYGDYSNPTEVQNGNEVPLGEMLRVDAYFDEGYELDHFLVDNVETPSESQDYAGIKVIARKAITLSAVAKAKAAPQPTKYTVTLGELPAEQGTFTATYGADKTSVQSGDELPDGTEITFTATPAEGYEFDYWMVNDAKSDDTNNPLVITLSAAVKVAPVMKAKPAPQPTEAKITLIQPDATQGLLIAYTYGSDGMPSTIVDGMTVKSGTEVTFAVSLKEGYEMDYWLVNDKRQEVEAGEFPHRKTIKVTSDIKVQPVLKAKTAPQPKKFEVSYSCGAHATIAGTVNGEPFESGDKLAVGTEVVLTVTPEEGYEVKHWIDSDDEVVPGSEGKNSYTFTVDGYTSIVAKIQKKKDTPQYETVHVKVEYDSMLGSITTTYVASNGSSEPQSISGEDDIPVGSVVTLRAMIFTPGYQVVYMNNGDVVSKDALSEDGLVYTFTANEDASIQALFSKKTTPEPTNKAKVTFKVEGSGGFILGNYKEPGADMVRSIFDGDTKDLPIGTVVTFTATLLSDAYQVTYTNNGEAVPAASLSEEGTVYKFTVKGDATVLATFAKKEVPDKDYTFTFEAGKGGTVTATVLMEPIESGAKIAAGTKIRVQATPDENYEIDEWLVNDKPVSTGGLDFYYVTLMKDTNVKVTFKSTKPVEYAVTVAPVQPSAEAGTVKLYKENGTAVESGTAVAVNTKMYVEVKPAAKYELETLQVNNTTIKAGDAALVNLTGGGFKYSFTVTETTTIKATFKLGGAVEQLTQNQIAAYVTNGGTRLEVTGATEGTEVRLYDYTGQLLLSSTEHALDISALPAGGYIVLVGNYTTRIVK